MFTDVIFLIELFKVNKKSASHPVGLAKDPASKDVMIKVAPSVELLEPAIHQPSLAIDHQSVRCDVAKISGWLHCEDPTGVS